MKRYPFRTYLVLAPRKVRPNQLINVFATVLKLEYRQLEIVVSVVKGEVQYADTKVTFDRTGSRVMQMLVRCIRQCLDLIGCV